MLDAEGYADSIERNTYKKTLEEVHYYASKHIAFSQSHQALHVVQPVINDLCVIQNKLNSHYGSRNVVSSISIMF